MSPQPRGQRDALTFGVEIEFLVAALGRGFRETGQDPHPDDAREVVGLDEQPPSAAIVPECMGWREQQIWFVELHVTKTITDAGFPALTLREVKDQLIPMSERVKSWIVHEDVSVEPPDTHGKYSWYRIEINSPAYYFTPGAVEAVKTVCAIISSTYRVHINNTAGMHCHVGNGTYGFETDVLRTLMAILFVFEPQLETLHPKHRTEGNMYCQSLWGQSRLGRIRNKSKSEMLEILLRADSRAEVVRLMSSWENHNRLAYNVKGLGDPYPDRNKRTIEFRNHESTLDPDRVANFLSLCCGLVEVPMRIDIAKLETFVRKHAESTVEEFDVIRLLWALNLRSQAQFYDARFHRFWIEAEKKRRVESETV